MEERRDLLWEPCGDPGLEHLRLHMGASGLLADGIIIRQRPAQAPFRLRYRIECDEAMRLRRTQIAIDSPVERSIDLRADGRGAWSDAEGATIEAVSGCIDLDIAATPFTNTLPIRRLSLKPGASAEIDVVYVTIPELEVRPLRQRYTCLSSGAGGAVYLYENCASGFTARLPVDDDGLVLDYPGQWKRRSTGEERG